MAAANRIPISVRISQEDADFIAELKIEGANTPSEKIRELLTQARLAHSQTHDYGTALVAQEQFFQVARRDVLHAEKEWGIHSHIVARLFEQLAADLPENAQAADLKRYECELMRRIVRLTDSILQLAVTGKGAAYDDTVLQQLENTLKLAKIVQQAGEV